MTSILSDRQRNELQCAILDFMHNMGYSQSIAAFREECRIDEEAFTPGADPKSKYAGLLEKKWTSVIRLQKKIMDLENKISQLQQELATAATTAVGPGGAFVSSSKLAGISPDWLPRAPPRYTLTSHRAPITALSLHPFHTLLASASEDNTVKIWDWETGEFERTLKGHTKSVQDIAWDPRVETYGQEGGGMLVSCSADLTIKVWDPKNEFKCIRTLHGHDHSVSAVCFIPGTSVGGGARIASASRDRTVRVWELATGYCVRTLHGHLEWVRSVRASQDGRWLVTGGNDQTCRVWDLPVLMQPGGASGSSDGKHELRGHDHVVECAEFVPVAAYTAVRELVRGVRGGLASLAASPEPTAEPPASITAETSGDAKKVPAESAAPGLYIISGSRDKTVRLFEVSTSRLLHTFHGHDNWVRSLAFHPNGKYFFSASDDKTIKVWDLRTGRCVRTLEAHSHFCTSVSVQTSGKIVGGGSGLGPVVVTGGVDNTVKIWECR